MKRWIMECVVRPDPDKWPEDEDRSERPVIVKVTAADPTEARKMAVHQALAVRLLVSRINKIRYAGKEVG